MFGFSAYAQTPYASTAGAVTPSNVSQVNETATGTDLLDATLTELAQVTETANATDE